MHEGGEGECVKYLKWGWKSKEGKENKEGGGQPGSRVSCLLPLQRFGGKEKKLSNLNQNKRLEHYSIDKIKL